MALECNIDAAGKAARLKVGIFGVTVGIGLALVTAIGILPSIAWWGALASIAGGTFTIWEARAGWCVVRAMGFQTPM